MADFYIQTRLTVEIDTYSIDVFTLRDQVIATRMLIDQALKASGQSFADFYKIETKDDDFVLKNLVDLANEKLLYLRDAYAGSKLSFLVEPTSARHTHYTSTEPPWWTVAMAITVKDDAGSTLAPNDPRNPLRVQLSNGIQLWLGLQISAK